MALGKVVLVNVVGNTEAGSADVFSLELVDSEVPAGKSCEDALYVLQFTPVGLCPDSFDWAST